jgi:hypothetical protein
MQWLSTSKPLCTTSLRQGPASSMIFFGLCNQLNIVVTGFPPHRNTIGQGHVHMRSSAAGLGGTLRLLQTIWVVWLFIVLHKQLRMPPFYASGHEYQRIYSPQWPLRKWIRRSCGHLDALGDIGHRPHRLYCVTYSSQPPSIGLGTR